MIQDLYCLKEQVIVYLREIYHLKFDDIYQYKLTYNNLFTDERPDDVTNPCVPSPCGPNSECRDIGNTPSCSCLASFIGSPPNCRPECTIHADCSSDRACINTKCRDPCPGSCGVSAVCSVLNHIPICTCIDGYVGDPFTSCRPKPLEGIYYFSSLSLF